MKILQIGSYLAPDLVGGAEISAKNVHNALSEAGHEVISLRSALGAHGLSTRVLRVSSKNWRTESWRPMSPISQGSQASKVIYYGMEFLSRINRSDFSTLLKSENIDFIMVHSLRGIGYDLLGVLAEADLPTIFFLHDLALVCLNKSKVRKGRLCSRPCVPCSLVTANTRQAFGRMSRVAILGPSHQILAQVRDELDVEELRCEHLPNPNRYAIVGRHRAGHAGRVTLGYVGRLDKEKGVAGLLPEIDRVAAGRDIRFVVAGKGALHSELVAYASQRPWVDYRGFVEPDETPRLYDDLDVLILPSLWPENFPGTAVQAITSGCPVVAFRIGGLPEIIDDNLSGRLVPFADFNALGNALAELVDEPETLARLSRGALSSARRFDPAELSTKLTELVRELAFKH